MTKAPPMRVMVTAAELKEKMADSEMDAEMAHAYIMGAVDSASVYSEMERGLKRFCPPETISSKTVYALVEDYLRALPTPERVPAAAAVAAAYHDAFGCKR
jgi:hypothetical protein